MSTQRLRVAILISGGGSNMLALASTAAEPDFPAEIRLVLSNRPDVGGLSKARALGIATASVDHKLFGANREEFEREIDRLLRINEIELVCLAGFMRVLTPWFVARWQGRLINIHPSLLPLYRGTHTHRQALDAGATEHGCSVHWVVPELDAGPVIAQARVPVLQGDTEETLAARVLVQEHLLYPQALRQVASSLRAKT